MRASEVIANGLLRFRPFDGTVYRFTIGSSELVEIDNPSFDLEHHSDLEETMRLREVMELLDELAGIVKQERSVQNG